MKREPTIVKRLLCLILTLVMAASVLAGCGGKEEEDLPVTTPVTTAPTEPPEIPYTADTAPGTEAVADILSIDPVYEITGANASYICECTTLSQGNIYVSVPAAVYYNTFGVLAKGMDLVNCPVTLPQPLHITGTVTDANTLYDGLTAQILGLPEEPVEEETLPTEAAVEETLAPEETIAEITALDPTAETLAAETIVVETTVEETVMETVVETTEATEPAPSATVLHVTAFDLSVSAEVSEFTPDSAYLAPAEAKIVKIYPAFPIAASMEGMLELVCEAQTVDGNIVWVYMPVQMFLDAFNGGRELRGAAIVFEADYYVRLQGIVRASEDLNPGLSQYAPTMLVVESYEIVDIPPETIPETVPETIPETIPEPTAETIPEPTAETIPEPTAAETLPEPVVETGAVG